MPKLMLLLALLMGALLAPAQSPSDPSRLTAEDRRQIVDALRLPLQARLGAGVVLTSKRLTVQFDGVHLTGKAVKADWERLEGDVRRISAHLQKSAGRWRVVTLRFDDEDPTLRRGYGSPSYRAPRLPSYRAPRTPSYRAPGYKPPKGSTYKPPAYGYKPPSYGAASNACGAPTKSGGSCKRKVKGGGRCYQHGG